MYKEAVRKDSVDIGEKTLVSGDIGRNETVEEFFRQVREDGAVTSELYDK